MPNRVKNRVGVRVGRLVVLERLENRRSSSGHVITRWLCECDCGQTTVLDGGDIEKGNVQSCGCLRAEMNRDQLPVARAAVDYQARGLARRSPDAGYVAAHSRVRRERGKAKYHGCTDCGAPAREWSYDHTDPDEVADEKGRPYSLKPEHYSPRCVPCHRAFDRCEEARVNA